jgi:hypothetical protein
MPASENNIATIVHDQLLQGWRERNPGSSWGDEKDARSEIWSSLAISLWVRASQEDRAAAVEYATQLLAIHEQVAAEVKARHALEKQAEADRSVEERVAGLRADVLTWPETLYPPEPPEGQHGQ